jgi:hypothetical protein
MDRKIGRDSGSQLKSSGFGLEIGFEIVFANRTLPQQCADLSPFWATWRIVVQNGPYQELQHAGESGKN